MYQMVDGYFVRFAKLDKEYRKMCFKAVEEYHFTANEIVVLMFLSNNPGMDSASDIARYKSISKGLVAKSVDSLCRRGLLKAEKDAADRRVLHLRLTENSRDVAERLSRCKEEFTSRLQQGIPKEYLEIMDKVSKIMDKNLEEMSKGMR